MEKTGRVVVVQEAQRQAGVAAQVVSEISERAILSLEAPIGRVSAPDTVSRLDKQKMFGYQTQKISKTK